MITAHHIVISISSLYLSVPRLIQPIIILGEALALTHLTIYLLPSKALGIAQNSPRQYPLHLDIFPSRFYTGHPIRLITPLQLSTLVL
jgi:hypothetical protein